MIILKVNKFDYWAKNVWCAVWRANHTPEVVMHYSVKKSECELCFSAVSDLEVEDPDVAAT